MKIKTQNGHTEKYNKKIIIDALMKDDLFLTDELKQENGITKDIAQNIAGRVTRIIKKLQLKEDSIISSDTIRGLVATELIEKQYMNLLNVTELVGLRIQDIYKITRGSDDTDNANLTPNPETSHKLIADTIMKKYYLRMIDKKLSTAHINGDIHCLAGEMPIIYKIDNNIYIKTIREFCINFNTNINYLVPSFNVENKIVEWKKVINAISNDKTQLYNVEFTKGKNIICTKDHPFYKTSGQNIQKNPKELKNFKIGDRIATLNYIPNFINNIETYKGNLIGFFLGDGTIAGKRICFHLKKNEKIEYLRNILKNLDIEFMYVINQDKTTSIFLYNDMLYNIHKNSKILELYKEEDILGIIGGLINSDGHIRLHGNNRIPYLEFDNTNEYIINLYYSLMLMQGINPSKQKYNDCYRCICSGKSITILLKKLRLRDPYNNIISSEYVHGSKITDVWSQMEIKSISKDRIDYTYDITVEDNHNFICGNGFILTGNCHDLEYFGTRPFCRSWDLRKFFVDGFSPDGENNGICAAAPKHAEVAILQATKVLAMGQCNHAGGQGLLYGTVFLAPYMKDKTYKEIKQLMQMMLYELNQMYISRGGQVIFSSINVSPGCPKVLENVPVVFAGSIYDGKQDKNDLSVINDLWTYKELEREIRLQFQALMELSIEGDSSGKLFPFPKIEVAIEKKFIDEKNPDYDNKMFNSLYEENDKDILTIPSYKELYQIAFEVVAKTGILYFDNLLPEKKNAEEGVGCTQCCSYSFATDKESDNNFTKRLNFEDGYYFNNLGGMQAVSINLPRCAYKSNKNIKVLMINIFDCMDNCIEVFKIKKEMINANIHRLKYLTQEGKNSIKLTDFDQLVYEIGIVGLNEMLQYFTGEQIGEGPEAIKIGKYVLSEMNRYCKMMSDLHGLKIVLARTPAETVAQKFAVSDLLNEEFREKAIKCIKGDLKTAIELCKSGSRDLPVYYSNGFAPYVGSELNILEKIKLEDEFWPFVDGGAITHIWLGEKDPDPIGLMKFAFNIFENTNIGYLAFTKDLSQCINCNNIMGGLIKECNKCKSDNINWFSRITGYYSEVAKVRNGITSKSRWNAAKTQELTDRNKINNIGE
jgi:ribonucleoside-triphosphate reductase